MDAFLGEKEKRKNTAGQCLSINRVLCVRLFSFSNLLRFFHLVFLYFFSSYTHSDWLSLPLPSLSLVANK